jgi:hypothetical protein
MNAYKNGGCSCSAATAQHASESLFCCRWRQFVLAGQSTSHIEEALAKTSQPRAYHADWSSTGFRFSS